MENEKRIENLLSEEEAVQIIKNHGGVELTEKEVNSPEYSDIFKEPSFVRESKEEYKG